MNPRKLASLLTIPTLAAGVAAAVLAYTSVPAPAPKAAANTVATEAASTSGPAVQVASDWLPVLPGWLRDCLEGKAPTSQPPNLFDPSTWPNPLDPNSWRPPDCLGLDNLQVPDWLDPNNLIESVHQHTAPQDWTEIQQFMQEAQQITKPDPGALAKLLARAWDWITKNRWVLLVILVVVGVLLIIGAIAGAAKSKNRQRKQKVAECPESAQAKKPRPGGTYKFNLTANDAAPRAHVGTHVAVRPTDLEKRFNANRNLEDNSTYDDATTATDFIQQLVNSNDALVKQWVQDSRDIAGDPTVPIANRKDCVLVLDFGVTTGVGFRRGDARANATPQPRTKAKAVLVFEASHPDGFFVLTSYPLE
jgi:hypothetical protein